MANEHTIRAFDEDMGQLNALIAQMGGLAENQVHDAIDALRRGDHDKASVVVARDKQLDALEAEVEKLAIQLIALRAPVASDLRQVVAAFKISGMLERVGDHAKNIARSTLKINDFRFGSLALVPAVAEIAAGMIHSALNAYAAQNAVLAEDVVARDKEVDALYRDMIRSLIDHLSEKSANVITATELLLVARNIERIGDNATNIAEAVYYASTGIVMPDRHTAAD
ncbi:phosphate signaling complex protein PhoU [Novosphingobium sp. Fuku2-ISO-50]|jgi:phosphate transport system protein|uniref:phosphate signaling complex protein PhoU n=1 Tax=Novosphingobium sp. Fuku2-ISO-50 TaxID=1739114 RepID=UPI00076C0CCA|nr:phosphate signaling complex protein PhoU [Novosphingobium sp. Fuku2-ISO-50]KUR75148.1 PhoU family transcriptional regulator [Novosphingobium sp. Fuku2-ISO-50]